LPSKVSVYGAAGQASVQKEDEAAFVAAARLRKRLLGNKVS